MYPALSIPDMNSLNYDVTASLYTDQHTLDLHDSKEYGRTSVQFW